MKRTLAVLLVFLLIMSLMIGFIQTAAAAPPFVIPPVQTASAMPPVVVVSGSNYEMGYQYAKQLAPLIYKTVTVLNSEIIPIYGYETVIKDMQVHTYYADKYNPELRAWMEGILAGCKEQGYEVSYEELMLATVFPSELWTRPEVPYPEEIDVSNPEEIDVSKIEQESKHRRGSEERHHSCTAFAATGDATRDGKPIIAISGGSTLELVDRVILIAFPDEGPSYVSLSTLGRPHDQMGMNSSGFAWVLTANFSADTPWGVMPEVAFHYLTQYCESPAEAQKWLESIPRTGACGNFVMSDAEGNISVTESNADCFFVRRPGDLDEPAEFIVNANHFAAPETINCNLPGWEQWNYDSITRYATCWEYVSAAAEQGAIDIEFTRKMFHSDDWFDPTTDKWHYNEPGSGNGFNILGYTQQSVFFPADLTAYFIQGTGSGTGIPAGATGEFIKVQLANDPVEVSNNMEEAAFSFYVEARDLFRKELNINAGLPRNSRYLTDLVVQSIEEMLDEAYLEYERGRDRAAFAYKAELEGTSINEQVGLWGEALSHYAKAQLFAQMVTARLETLTAK